MGTNFVHSLPSGSSKVGTLEVTQDEILRAIQDAMANMPPENEPGTFTTRVVREALDLPRERCIKTLEAMCEQGIIEKAMVRRVDGWGFVRKTAGYRIV
jgi:hypothetical protein